MTATTSTQPAGAASSWSGAAPAAPRPVYAPGQRPPAGVKVTRAGRFSAFRAIGDESADPLIFIDHRRKGIGRSPLVTRMGVHRSELYALRDLVEKLTAPRCEGCGGKPTTSDSEGVPLCGRCKRELVVASRKESTRKGGMPPSGRRLVKRRPLAGPGASP